MFRICILLDSNILAAYTVTIVQFLGRTNEMHHIIVFMCTLCRTNELATDNVVCIQLVRAIVAFLSILDYNLALLFFSVVLLKVPAFFALSPYFSFNRLQFYSDSRLFAISPYSMSLVVSSLLGVFLLLVKRVPFRTHI